MRRRISFPHFGVGVLSAALVAFAACSRDSSLTSPAKRLVAHVPSRAVGTTVSGATLVTDKDDYQPGDTLKLSGAGWQAGDTLDVVLDETPQNHPPVNWAIGVGADGTIADSTYVVQLSDLGVTFNITATSRATGETAQATFTDAAWNLTITALSPTSPTAGGLFDVSGSIVITGAGTDTWKASEWWIDTGTHTCVNSTDVTGSTASSPVSFALTGLTAPATTGPHTLWVQLWSVDDCIDPPGAGNPALGGQKSFAFTVAAAANHAPVLGTINDITDLKEETQGTFTATATDADGDAVTFTIAACASGTYPDGADMTTAGVFTWTPAENQGAATYCVKVVATDTHGAADSHEVSITVLEVNKKPTITVPSDFSIKWGVALSSVNASATDPDLSAPPPGSALNNLTFSLITFPTGMTIDVTSGKSPISRAISWTPTSAQVGSNSVKVRVTDDGSPAMYDEASFTITVTSHATTLTYNGASAGQYSDVSKLCATLTDDDASNAGISGKTITFSWDGISVGTGTTDANGKACTNVTSNVYTVTDPNGNHTVKAAFAGDAAYDAATADNNTFDVDAEEATVTPDAGNQNAYQVGAPGGTASFTLKFSAMETYLPSEPNANDKALPGDITKAVLNLSLVAVGGGGTVNPSSCTPSGTGNTYGSTRTFTCSFSGVPVETYQVNAVLDGKFYTGSYSDVLTVFDPSLGFVTGGGTYFMNGDRVNFGFTAKIVQNKKNSVVQGSLLVIRHKSDGQVARIKSNVFDGLAVGTGASAGTATFSGKASYSLNGVTDPTNYDFTAYVVDGGTPGAGVDMFSLYHGKANALPGYEVRTSPSLAALKSAPNVMTLTGGNIQVPQPQGGK